MTKNEERTLFLEYLNKIYKEIPNDFNEDTVYKELQLFNIKDDKIDRIANINLVSEKAQLLNNYNKKYNKKQKNKSKIVYDIKEGEFYGFENVIDENDRPFSGKLNTAIKMYIPTNKNDICDLFDKILDYVVKEKIKIQIKLSDTMRNDNVVIRTLKINDANKIANFIIENKKNISDIKPNPFLIEKDNIGYAVDGKLSYNRVLAKLIDAYIKDRNNSNKNHISETDLKKFINEQLNIISSVETDLHEKNIKITELMSNFDIRDEDTLKDFVLISNKIIKNITGKLNVDNISTYQEIKSIITPKETNDKFYDVIKKDFKEKKYHNIINYIMFYMSNYYSEEEKNIRIIEYIKTENIALIPRIYGIRSLIDKNFNKDTFKNYIMLIGKEALISACIATYKKHGPEQLKMALKTLQENGKLDYFTNDNDVRSYLGLIIPTELLKEISTNYDEIISETLEKISEENIKF